MRLIERDDDRGTLLADPIVHASSWMGGTPRGQGGCVADPLIRAAIGVSGTPSGVVVIAAEGLAGHALRAADSATGWGLGVRVIDRPPPSVHATQPSSTRWGLSTHNTMWVVHTASA